jgi:chromosome segregation ATPase
MKLSTDVKRSIARARKVIETRDKIQTALDQSVMLQPGAEAQLQNVMESLGTTEAEAAISGESAPIDGRTALQDARMSCDVLQARIAGLERKLSAHESEITAAADELDGTRNKLSEDCVVEYQAQIAKAAAEFSSVLRQGAALSDALGIIHLEMAIRKITIPNLFGDLTPLIDMDVSEWTENGQVIAPIWRGDAAAESVYNALCEPLSVASSLKAK